MSGASGKAAPAGSGPRSTPFGSAGAVGDFFAPFFSIEFTRHRPAEVKSADGKDSPTAGQWVASGNESRFQFQDQEKEIQLRSFATSLDVRIPSDSKAAVAVIRFEPPYEDAVRICESGAVQQDSLMSIQWGYLPSGPGMKEIVTPLHTFVMTTPPALEVSGADVSITLTGQEVFAEGAMRRESRVVYPRNTAVKQQREETSGKLKLMNNEEDVGKRGLQVRSGSAVVEAPVERTTNDSVIPLLFPTDLDILKHLAGKFNMEVNSGLAIHSTLVDDRSTGDPVEQTTTDYALFKRLCNDNRCEFFVVGGTIFIADTNYIKTQQASYQLVAMRQPRDELDIPILAFTTQALQGMFQREAAEARRVSADPDSGFIYDIGYDGTTAADHEHLAKRIRGGIEGAEKGRQVTVRVGDRLQLVTHPLYQQGETGRHVATPDGVENKAERVARLSRLALERCNNEMMVTIPGVPSVAPQMIVQVRVGFPTTFDGPYRVTEVSHKLDSSGYECELKLIRDGISNTEKKDAGKESKTGGNDPPLQESGSESVVPKNEQT